MWRCDLGLGLGGLESADESDLIDADLHVCSYDVFFE
jgi:hypothetical protein